MDRVGKYIKTRERENEQYTTSCIDISRNRVIMRGIWHQCTCRQHPIMRFDRCFVPSFLYFELYAISSIKLFRHQLYFYARQSGPMRICPASCRYLRTFYTFYRAVPYIYNFFLKNSHFINTIYCDEIIIFIFTQIYVLFICSQRRN